MKLRGVGTVARALSRWSARASEAVVPQKSPAKACGKERGGVQAKLAIFLQEMAARGRAKSPMLEEVASRKACTQPTGLAFLAEGSPTNPSHTSHTMCIVPVPADRHPGRGAELPNILVAFATLATFAGSLYFSSRSSESQGKPTASEDEDLPESIDWEAKGAVNIPQDQGNCGSCWAHVAVGSIEGIHQITYGELHRLSVQQIIDCAVRHFDHGDVKGRGCSGGGFIQEAYEHAIKQGCVSEKSYPLRWFRGDGKCIECGLKVVAHIHGYIRIEPTEKALMRAVSKQPVAVYVDRCPPELKKSYSGGLIEFHDWPAGRKGEKPRHAVVVVGYGKDDNGNLYWKVKNSWGNQWGDRGFGYLRRGSSDKGGVGGILRYRGLAPTICS